MPFGAGESEMKKTFGALFLIGAVASTSHAGLVITEVMSSSSHPTGTSNSDWFELTNTGASVIDLNDYRWDDNTLTTPNTFNGTFGGVTIGAGKSIVFTGETVTDEASFRSDWNIPAAVTVVNLGGTVFQSFSSSGD